MAALDLDQLLQQHAAAESCAQSEAARNVALAQELQQVLAYPKFQVLSEQNSCSGQWHTDTLVSTEMLT